MQEYSEQLQFPQVTNPRINMRLKYLKKWISRFLPRTRLSVDRAVDRPPNSPIPVDRAGRPKKPESWVLSVKGFRSTGRSTEKTRELGFVSQSPAVDRPVDRDRSCACCARRSTGPVDRSPVLLCCCCFLPAVPLPFVVDSSTIFDSTWHDINSTTVLSHYCTLSSNNSPPR